MVYKIWPFYISDFSLTISTSAPYILLAISFLYDPRMGSSLRLCYSLCLNDLVSLKPNVTSWDKIFPSAQYKELYLENPKWCYVVHLFNYLLIICLSLNHHVSSMRARRMLIFCCCYTWYLKNFQESLLNNEWMSTIRPQDWWINNYTQTVGSSDQDLGLVFVSSDNTLHIGAQAVSVELDSMKIFYFLFNESKCPLCKWNLKIHFDNTPLRRPMLSESLTVFAWKTGVFQDVGLAGLATFFFLALESERPDVSIRNCI